MYACTYSGLPLGLPQYVMHSPNKQIGCVSSAVLIFAMLIMRERQCSKWTDGIAGSLTVVFCSMHSFFLDYSYVSVHTFSINRI